MSKRTNYVIYSTSKEAVEAAQKEADDSGVIQYIHKKLSGYIVTPDHPNTPEELTHGFVPALSTDIKYKTGKVLTFGTTQKSQPTKRHNRGQ